MSEKFLGLRRLTNLLERLKRTLNLSGTTLKEVSLENPTTTGTLTGHVVPSENNTYDLGSDSGRWRNIYTGDLNLKNERGDWTIVEESEYLCVINNATGKKFKIVLEPIDDDV